MADSSTGPPRQQWIFKSAKAGKSGRQHMNKTTKRRTEITIETREIKTIRIRSLGDATYCMECGKTTMSCDPEHIAKMLHANVGDVLRSIADGQLHLTRTSGAADGVCVNSLEDLVAEQGWNVPEKVQTLLCEPQATIYSGTSRT